MNKKQIEDNFVLYDPLTEEEFDVANIHFLQSDKRLNVKRFDFYQSFFHILKHDYSVELRKFYNILFDQFTEPLPADKSYSLIFIFNQEEASKFYLPGNKMESDKGVAMVVELKEKHSEERPLLFLSNKEREISDG